MHRIELGAGAWLDVALGWFSAHAALFADLRRSTAWQAHRRLMYERRVAVPRLTGSPAVSSASRRLLEDASQALSARYGRPLVEISLALYRDGADSVAMHGDTLTTDVDDAIVAILSLGAPRRFVMRRVAQSSEGDATVRGPSTDVTSNDRFWKGADRLVFTPSQGDLLVMGGTAQRTWLHGVPKVASAGERIAVMFR
jgi:alkylated DNA repair dioxygenase AlkB